MKRWWLRKRYEIRHSCSSFGSWPWRAARIAKEELEYDKKYIEGLQK